MSHLSSKVTDVITFPARTAFGAASLGVRTGVRVLGWAAGQVLDHAPAPTAPTAPTTPPVTVPDPRPAEPMADPMEATRTAPTQTPAPAPTPAKRAPARKKVPAGQVPLKSAPTPSLPAALETFDEAGDLTKPVPAKKAPAKKTPAKKTPAKKTAAKKAPAKKAAPKKAPSKQAAVLAPALGLSEDEVAEVIEPGADNS